MFAVNLVQEAFWISAEPLIFPQTYIIIIIPTYMYKLILLLYYIAVIVFCYVNMYHLLTISAKRLYLELQTGPLKLRNSIKFAVCHIDGYKCYSNHATLTAYNTVLTVYLKVDIDYQV